MVVCDLNINICKCGYAAGLNFLSASFKNHYHQAVLHVLHLDLETSETTINNRQKPISLRSVFNYDRDRDMEN